MYQLDAVGCLAMSSDAGSLSPTVIAHNVFINAILCFSMRQASPPMEWDQQRLPEVCGSLLTTILTTDPSVLKFLQIRDNLHCRGSRYGTLHDCIARTHFFQNCNFQADPSVFSE